MTGITGTNRRRTASLVRTAAVLLGVAGALAGCGALDVSDPTAIEESELNDAAGAQLLRGAALRALSEATDKGAFYSGLLADEFLSNPPSFAAPGTYNEEVLDRRESAGFEQLGDGFYAGIAYVRWQELRHAASVALPKLRAYAPAGAGTARVGEMFALRGFGALRLAEDFCPGFPLYDMVDYKLVYGPPRSTEQALEKALADFDSAVTYAADSARVSSLARVGRARTLLALGRFAEARAAVDGVPTDYTAKAEYLVSAGRVNRELAFGQIVDVTRSVANREGGSGLDFVSAGDPRLRLTPLGTAPDGVTSLYAMAKYPNQNAPVIVASGVEARLIEAEAALRVNPNDPQWLTILNTLRTSCTNAATCPSPAPAGSGGVGGLPPLADPGTAAARVDLLFRERAFWLFATGTRLGDLRRLVRVYGRPTESVFPTGGYRLGGTYATATSIPFPAAQETPHNPAVTGCTSR